MHNFKQSIWNSTNYPNSMLNASCLVFFLFHRTWSIDVNCMARKLHTTLSISITWFRIVAVWIGNSAIYKHSYTFTILYYIFEIVKLVGFALTSHMFSLSCNKFTCYSLWLFGLRFSIIWILMMHFSLKVRDRLCG